MTELLRVEHLRAGYGEAVVLNDVSLSLPEGETLALLGRNGTGKTTLINTLIGATRQHAGRITLAGVALDALRSHERAAAGIGWVPQERNIFKSLTVHENLTAVARLPRDAGGVTAGRRRAHTPALDARAGVRDVSEAGRAPDQPGHATVGRRATDARRGPCPGPEPAPAAAGRTAGRAWRRSSSKSCCRPSPASRATKGCRPSSSSSTRRPFWPSATARWCWTMARWFTAALPRHCSTSPHCWTGCWAWRGCDRVAAQVAFICY